VTAEELISEGGGLTAVAAAAASSSSSSSQYERLRDQIASTLDVPVDNVDVFSVRDHPALSRTVDVLYSAHGSPHYRHTRLDTLVSLNIAQVTVQPTYRDVG